MTSTSLFLFCLCIALLHLESAEAAPITDSLGFTPDEMKATCAKVLNEVEQLKGLMEELLNSRCDCVCDGKPKTTPVSLPQGSFKAYMCYVLYFAVCASISAFFISCYSPNMRNVREDEQIKLFTGLLVVFMIAAVILLLSVDLNPVGAATISAFVGTVIVSLLSYFSYKL